MMTSSSRSLAAMAPRVSVLAIASGDAKPRNCSVQCSLKFVAGRCGPSRRVGPGVAADDPAHLRERVATLGLGGGDVLLERSPAAHPVLTGDGQLGVV